MQALTSVMHYVRHICPVAKPSIEQVQVLVSRRRHAYLSAGQRRVLCHSSASVTPEGSGGDTNSAGDPNLPRLDVEKGMSPEAAALQAQQDLKKPRSFWGKVKRLFVGEKLDRKRLAALGKQLCSFMKWFAPQCIFPLSRSPNPNCCTLVFQPIAV